MKTILLLLLFVIIQSSNALNYQFLHVSDIHYSSLMNSQLYNSSVLCIGPSLTREYDHEEHKQLIEDEEKLQLPTNGLYGRYGCDTNDLLLTELFNQMEIVSPNPDFIIYTGDGAGHGLPNGPWSESQTTLAKTFYTSYPNTPIIPTIGNNDVFPDYNSQCNDSNLEFLYQTWAQWIPTSQIESFIYTGSFAVQPVPGLTVISLNTILYSVKNKNVFENPADPCGQFAWLQQQLTLAQTTNNNVYIIGHIFPGLDPFSLTGTWKSDYQTSFFNLVSNFQSLIKAGMFGHIHRDEIRSIQFSDPTLLQNNGYFPMFIGASVTPVYFNNPSFKLFGYDSVGGSSSSKNITNITAFYTDVYVSNEANSMVWNHEYDFATTYDVDVTNGIGGAQLSDLISRLTYSNDLFNIYDNFRFGSYNPDNPIMTCVAKSSTVEQFQACSIASATVA